MADNKNKAIGELSTKRVSIPVDTVVIYRCGWCGLPTDKDGKPLEVNADEYLKLHDKAKTENTHGWCCQNEYQS